MRRALLLLAPLLFSACTAQLSVIESQDASSSAVAVPPAPTEHLYTNTAEGYSVMYPDGWTIEEKTKPPLMGYSKRTGVSFWPPEGFAKGTGYLDGRIFIETTRPPCVQYVNPVDATLGGKDFLKGSTSTVGAKNYQRLTLFTLLRDKNTCHNFTLYVRGCHLGAECGQNNLNSFDPVPLNQLFERMVASFKKL